MQLITLTTDWGTSDFFAGMVKGRLYSTIPDVQIVDIAHDILPYNVIQASFVVRNACLDFPAETIHIIDVDTHETKDQPYVVVKYNNQYYICADNGIPSAVFNKKEIDIVQIKLFQDSNFYTFPAYNLFCLVASELAKSHSLESVGYVRNKLAPYTAPTYSYYPSSGRLDASIMYIDSYGNAYLNITYEEFESVRQGRKIKLSIGTAVAKPIKVSLSYFDSVDYGENGLVLTVSATGYMEIALLHESAQDLLEIRLRKSVTIHFE